MGAGHEVLHHAAVNRPHVPAQSGDRRLTRLAQWWYRRVRPWWAIVAFAGFSLFGATVLPAQAERAEQYTAGAGSPDTNLAYSADELVAAAAAYGADGRSDFVVARVTFDVVWPLVYAVTLCILLTVVLRAATRADSRWRLANLLPWAGLIADYLENAATSIVMLTYPDVLRLAARIAPVLTFTKWLLVGASFVVLIVGAVAAVVRRVRRGPADWTPHETEGRLS